jgi:hypothetical protein
MVALVETSGGSLQSEVKRASAVIDWQLEFVSMRIVVLLSVATLLHAAPVRKWHDAEVVSVKNIATFVFMKSLTYDASCRLQYREFRNPFRPLKGDGQGSNRKRKWLAVYLDNAGRTHKGTLQYLFANVLNRGRWRFAEQRG